MTSLRDEADQQAWATSLDRSEIFKSVLGGRKLIKSNTFQYEFDKENGKAQFEGNLIWPGSPPALKYAPLCDKTPF